MEGITILKGCLGTMGRSLPVVLQKQFRNTPAICNDVPPMADTKEKNQKGADSALKRHPEDHSFKEGCHSLSSLAQRMTAIPVITV
jgi:hypothetical protein